MSSSDSDSESAGANTDRDTRIEQCIRTLVAKTFAQDPGNLTLKRIRTKAEAELDLEEGYLKANAQWNIKSKEIVADELSIQQKAPSSPASEKKPNDAPPPGSSLEEKRLPSRPRKAAKRKSGEDGPDDKKRRKVSAEGSMGKGKPREFAESKRKAEKPFSSRDEESDADVTRRSLSETLVADEQLEDTGKTETTLEHQQRRKKRPTIESSPAPASPTPEVELELDKAPEQTNGAKSNEDMKDESDLSSLEDDSPPPKAKQRRKKGDTEADKPNKSKPTKPEPKSKPESTPQEAEIKKLQGQLVKCGVRKVWGSYLKKYETPKQKIAHLRNMLEDVGMTGRFSEDRARQIKEERELKADIDAITEGEKKWGKAPEEPGRKRLAKGLQELEGLVDDDAESD